MKKNGIINSEISKVLSDMGHTDYIVIADCGLPIPGDVIKIDLSVKQGMPTLLQVLEELEKDMEIEKVTLASEVTEHNQSLGLELKDRFETIDYLPHDDFKIVTSKAKAIIRTGEATPYANIILHSGVIF
ncbi:D-ribose pyranase [Pseudalkalibacillus decolorationis]|uniref:D-ribose pyranase n=1 Tax=Pseudalkalibacillus decolorationis TaxID=163879 RepID=UPI00214951D3|nr:D-ribose pyranase [Pseudalkalibacillus decolorationis]